MLLTLSSWPNLGRNWTASRTEPKPQLTDEQWLLIADLFPEKEMTHVGGRPPVPPRPCLEGILWVLISGARWKDLPTHFPSPATCWRRLNEWTRRGVFQIAWSPTAPPARRNEVSPLGRGDGRRHVCPGQKRGLLRRQNQTRQRDQDHAPGRRPRHAPGCRHRQCQSGGSETDRDTAQQNVSCRKRPQRLLYDRAADSDPLRERLAQRRIELICPHRRGRKRPRTQDGRAFRRYERRWKIERSIAWLFNYRRLVVRYEHHDFLFRGLLQLACAFTILKRF